MSWRDVQRRMIEELNTKIFFDDPCRKLHEEYSSMDIENTNYIQELKNRNNSPERYNGSLIEKKKYDFGFDLDINKEERTINYWKIDVKTNF